MSLRPPTGVKLPRETLSLLRKRARKIGVSTATFADRAIRVGLGEDSSDAEPDLPEGETAPDTAERTALLEALAMADRLEQERCEQSFVFFVKCAWHVLEPTQPLSWNWHLDLLCGELEDITLDKAHADVTINEPPGCMKSFLLVFWNAWEWGPRKLTHLRYLCCSHTQGLSSRDNQRVRDLIQSRWFQKRWPHVQLRDDQNQVTRFNTTEGGWRLGTSVGSQAAMGEHPHRKIIDDAHNPEGVPGEKERESVWHWFTQTISQRGHGLSAITVAVGQRLHEDDLFGRIRTKLTGWTHIVLPMRYEPPALVDGVLVERMRRTPSGRTDPRTEAGQLLWPSHLTEEAVQKSQALLGGVSSEGVAAQHQQSPMAPGGNQFQRSWFPILSVMPLGVTRWVRFWDVAATAGGTGPQTVGIKMGRTSGGHYIIAGNIVAGRWSPDGVHTVILGTSKLDGQTVVIREEGEGGSSGPAVIAMRTIALGGWNYRGPRPRGSKEERAQALRAQAEAGNVYLVARNDAERQQIEVLLDQLTVFPRGALKDYVDASAGAFNTLVELEAEHPTPSPYAAPVSVGEGGGYWR